MNVLAIFTALADKVRALVGLVLPIFAEAADFQSWGPWVRRLVHLILVALVLTTLYLVQPLTGINNYLQVGISPRLQPFYLCGLALVVYLMAWVAYGLVKLLGEDQEASEFPEVERQWRYAVGELRRLGFPLNDPDRPPPLFLVIGQPAGGTDALMKATEWNIPHRLPAEKNARVVVYASANPPAIVVAAPDAAAWSYLCATLDGDTRYAPPIGSPEEADPTKTISIGGAAGSLGMSAEDEYELKQLLKLQSTRGLTEAQRERLEYLAAAGNKGQTVSGGRPLTIRAEVLARGRREFAFLCKLIKRDRWPLCPVNGVLAVVPWAAGHDDALAQQCAQVLQEDLRSARTVFQLHYQTLALLGDMETARGFPEFRSSFAPPMLKQRLGQRLRLLPGNTDNEPDGPTVNKLCALWVGQGVAPVWILKALKLDTTADARETPTGGMGHNRNLYMLLREVYLRVPRMATILGSIPGSGRGEAAADDPLAGLSLFGGCYMAGTGRKGSGQAFIKGVFQRLVDDQAVVAWSGAAYAEDRRFRTLAAVGYGVTAVVAAGLVALALALK